jgi:16S rRNA (guanine(527)-N(7))-methyltransferase RsmG
MRCEKTTPDLTKHLALRQYVRMIQESGQSLVSKKTLESWETMWDAHIADSLQLAEQVKPGERVIDVGSGAGFPGLVVAIDSMSCDVSVVLVEPRRQRAVFLQSVVNTLGLNAHVTQSAISRVSMVCDVITARAVGTIHWLLRQTEHLVIQNPNSRILVIKSTNFAHEITEAQKSGWVFDLAVAPLCKQNGYLLCLSKIKHTTA